MRHLFLLFVLVIGIPAFGGPMENIQKMANDDQKEGPCRDISGPYDILKKYDDHRYLIGEQFYDRSRDEYTHRQKMILQTERSVFNKKGNISNTMWVEVSGKKAKGDDGFDIPLAEEKLSCAVAGSIQESGKFAIAFAAKDGDLDLVKALHNQGQDINTKDAKGNTVLDIAESKDRTEVVKYLIENGAKSGAARLSEKFGLALSNKRLEDATVIIDQGLDVNSVVSNEKMPVLFMASFLGSVEIVKKLLDKGANVNAPSGNKSTSLMVASFMNKKEIVELLLGRGANPNLVDDKKRTARSMAMEKKNLEIVKILEQHGAKK